MNDHTTSKSGASPSVFSDKLLAELSESRGMTGIAGRARPQLAGRDQHAGSVIKRLLLITPAAIALALATATHAQTQTYRLRKLVQSGDSVVGTPGGTITRIGFPRPTRQRRVWTGGAFGNS
jgi:hypothetical protein